MKRVVLTGSESTGKTTLARRLVEHYDAVWVPEFVRDYASKKSSPIGFADHGPIALGQIALEDERQAEAAQRGATLLVQDTDLLSTVVYCRHYFGSCPDWIELAAAGRRPDLYLLLDIDLPWIPDPVRDRGHMREEMQALFREELGHSGVPHVTIRGEGDARLAAARDAIEEFLHAAR